jgi:7-cyano-7-deazaguanine synthase
MNGILLLSGGLDSCVLASSLVNQGVEVVALSFLYGQRHTKEVEAADKISKALKIQHHIIDIWSVFTHTHSALTDLGVKVPEGHYEDASMRLTVVPCRNLVFASIASSMAEAMGLECVFLAVHSGDHAIYPDCRPDFIEALKHVVALSGYGKVKVCAPFIEHGMNKADIVMLGSRIGAPMGASWSCYNGRAKHCGVCGTCVERKEAFCNAGIEDPTKYEAHDAEH